MRRPKITALLLCLALALSMLAGCGKNAPSNNAANNVPAGPAISEEEMAKLDDIAKAGAEAIAADRINEGTYPIKVVSGSQQFKIKDSKLVAVAGVLQLVLNVEGDTYSKIFAGSAADAASASSAIDGEKNSDGTTTFRIPVKSLNDVVKFAAYADEYGKWFDRTLLADASSLDTAAVKPIDTADADGDKDDPKPDDTPKKDDEPKKDDTPKKDDEPKKDDTPKKDDEPKKDDTPKDDPKPDDTPKDDPKPDDTPKEDPKPDDTPKDDPPKDDPTPDDPPKDDPTPDDPKPDDPPQEDPKPDDTLADGDYSVKVNFGGGTGKARILSPATLHVKGGKLSVTIKWSSSNYDYMKVGGVKYLPDSISGGSVFTFPIPGLGQTFTVIGDTTAMSTPHEIEYQVSFELQ
ncbi:MAG: hypothetical protein IJM39_00990 [Firmicutes bacterium]|nr:hypothetical protein [Bacillota bacterium]